MFNFITPFLSLSHGYSHLFNLWPYTPWLSESFLVRFFAFYMYCSRSISFWVCWMCFAASFGITCLDRGNFFSLLALLLLFFFLLLLFTLRFALSSVSPSISFVEKILFYWKIIYMMCVCVRVFCTLAK